MQTQVVTPPGTRRYKIERELGRGGMGVVYQAYDLERHTRVALKALTQTDALNIYRLKNEFRQLSDLSHPNLVSLHELTFDGDQWFFTMELIDGVTFDEYVVEESPSAQRPSERALQATLAGRSRTARDVSMTLTQPSLTGGVALPRSPCDHTRLRAAVAQLVAAIGALHDAGKLHRDIKPSNVLVTPEGRVVVLDFGLVSNSTRVEQDTQDPERTIGGTVFGTPAYMSPEQAAGDPITTASDWYSVGSIIYEALTGQLPFDGTVFQILKQKEELEPPAPTQVVSGVPEDLDQLCRALLQRRPEDRPSGAEIARMFSGSSLPPPLREALPENRTEMFVGREPHLRALHEAFAAVRSGQSSIVFVHGHSGMGKSALVRCFANDLIKGAEAVVLRGRCYERESVPYKAFDDIIDALSRYMVRLPAEEAAELLPRNVHSLARLFPVLKRVRAVAHARVPLHQTDDPQEMRNQAFGALKDLLLRLSDWQPLVINIDDLQWADMDSARLLSYLLGPPEPPPVLFVGVYRRDEAHTSAFLRQVLADARLNTTSTLHLAVDALSSAETKRLTGELLFGHPDAAAPLIDAITTESEGVPFFIGELSRHVYSHLIAGAPAPPVSLQHVISARLRELSEGSARLLEVLSVAARPLEQGVALEAAGRSASDRAAFQELRAARMVRTRGTRESDFAETYHDRVRDAVVERLAPERVREIHARLARTSENWGVGEPEQLVVHYTEAGEGGRAGETAIHAAAAAADKLAFDRAADLYRKAIELLPTSDRDRRRQLQMRLGESLANAGRGAQSAEAYLEAAQELSDAGARHLKRKAAQQLLASGRFQTGRELAAELLDKAGHPYPETNATLRLAYTWTRSRIAMRGLDYTPRPPARLAQPVIETLETLALFRGMNACDPLAAAWLQGRYLLAALDAGDETAIIQALPWECLHLSLKGGASNLRRAENVTALAKRLAEQLGTPIARASHQAALAALNLFGRGRYRDAYHAACEGEAILRTHCPGQTWEVTWLASAKCIALEFTGELSTLLRETPQRERDAADRDDRFSLALLVHSVPLAHLMRDDPDGALAFISQQAERLGPRFGKLHLLALARQVDALLYAGRGREALDEVTRAWAAMSGSELARSRVPLAIVHLLRARSSLSAYGEQPRAILLESVARDSAALRRFGPGFAGFVPLLDAQLALLRNDAPSAQACFEAAIKAFSNAQADHAVQYVQYRLSELMLLATGSVHLKLAVHERLERQGIVDVPRWIRTWAPVQP
jgi:serine/threonine protein kinase